MGVEIERKFLVDKDSDAWRRDGEIFRQGYLSTHKGRTVRIRVRGERGFITVKGLAEGLRRVEFEYEIPKAEATAMLERLCEQPIIEKTRYHVPYGAHLWEVDAFHGANAGLVVAEIELGQPEEEFEKPSWLGAEVTGQARYFNSRLVKEPYSTWEKQ